jgi:uncharacterized protein
VDIRGIIWLDEIVDKLYRKHQVSLPEIREVMLGRPHVRYMKRGNRRDEDVYGAFGRSGAGRYLMVFFVWKKDRRALILSARDMTEKERGYYGKKS